MKIGIVGLGHLGKIHIKCIKDTPFKIAGIFDINPEVLSKVSKHFGLKPFSDLESLLSEVDVVDIVSSSQTHFDIAQRALEKSKHVFIEKPFVSNSAEGQILKKLALASNTKVQLGHVERYNPAVKALIGKKVNPKFIEVHRLASFNPRGTDVSVIMDLMIHDLDLLTYFIDAEVSSVDANGVCVLNETEDICNARIKFDNGAVANLTSSRISLKQMRKFRLFQEDKYVSLDLARKEYQEITLSTNNTEGSIPVEGSGPTKFVTAVTKKGIDNNAIVEEFVDFYNSIAENKEVNVSIDDGLRSLRIAEQIQQSIFVNNKKLES